MSIRHAFTAIAVIFSLFFTQKTSAQELSMKVTRSTSISRDLPIQNIFVDADNTKWVGYGKGAYEVKAFDLIGKISPTPGEQIAYAFPGGNADLRWTEKALEAQLEKPLSTYNYISAIWYDATDDILWLGTAENGLYRLKTKPQLQRIEHLQTTNSKLPSDVVHHIFREKSGRFWIGTEAGLLIGKPGAWRVETEFKEVLRVREVGNDIWVLGDGDIWNGVNSKKWSRVEVDGKFLEGEPRDFAVDKDGNLWVVSEAVAKINLQGGTSELYDQFKDFTSQQATCVATDGDGAVWVGTADKGIYLLEKNDAITVNFLIEKELSCTDYKPEAALRVKITGGTPPFKYQWSDAALKGENPQNLAPGTYTLTVTSSDGRVKIAKTVIADPRMTINAMPSRQASTPTAADGAAEVSITGGKPDYKIRWDNGETGPSAQKLTPGSHSVNISDAKGCTAVTSVLMGGKSVALVVGLQASTEIKCNGDKTGGLKAAVTGGKGPYQYAWSNAALKGDQAENLPAGEYQITVTDAEGTKNTAKLSINQPEKVTLTAKVLASASTGNSDGKAEALAAGGSNTFNFKWDDGENTSVATKLPPGKHTVTVTDFKGCSSTAQVEITENVLPLTITLTEKTKIKCLGQANGALAVQVVGGKAPFTFAWNNAAAKGETPDNLGAGDYAVTVTDAAGGKSAALISLSQPKEITAIATVESPASTSKSDGKASIKPKGGTGTFTYKWDNGETTATATQLAPTKHSATVTDANGCNAIVTLEVSENIIALRVNIEEKVSNRCFGNAEATLQVLVSGGKAPFLFAWSNPNAKGELATGLSGGDYAVTVTDAAGGKASANANVAEPKAIAPSASVESPASTGNSDGKAIAKATGGTGAYSYKWDNGETASTATKLAPGKHKVTVSDANGCMAFTEVEIRENILALKATLEEKTSIACFGKAGAALQVAVSGGKGPFAYAWSTPDAKGDLATGLTAGDYTVTVTDAAGGKTSANTTVAQPKAIAPTTSVESAASTGKSDGKASAKATGGTGSYSYKWDNGATTATVSNLSPGKHDVTVSDANGCTATTMVVINENILALKANIEEKAGVPCFGKSEADLKVAVTGGKAPFAYAWSNPAANGETPTDLPAGDYTVTVTDAVGGKATATFRVDQPKAIVFTATIETPASTGKSDGKAIAKASGGTGGFTFKWDNGETTATASNLAPGKHGVTATDGNGCTIPISMEMTENILPFSASIEVKKAIKCADENDAQIAVQVSGGKPPYQYKWSDAAQKGEQLTNLVAGKYSVTVTDALGTTKTAEAKLTAPEPLKANIAKNTPASNEKTRDGKALLAVKGGLAPYTFHWENDETTIEAQKLMAGTHTCLVTDANGCSVTVSVETAKKILPELTAGLLRTGQTLRMEQLNFDADSTNFREDSKPVINELYAFLEENPNIVVEIGGHTNNIPPDEFCDQLSTARAKAVADFIVKRGIDPRRIVHKGYGKRSPVASNLTPEGRKRNQRVEIKILQLVARE